MDGVRLLRCLDDSNASNIYIGTVHSLMKDRYCPAHLHWWFKCLQRSQWIGWIGSLRQTQAHKRTNPTCGSFHLDGNETSKASFTANAQLFNTEPRSTSKPRNTSHRWTIFAALSKNGSLRYLPSSKLRDLLLRTSVPSWMAFVYFDA